MSDGPHRSLPLNRAWRRATEHAENSNFDIQIISKHVEEALEHDLRKMIPKELRNILQKMALRQQSELPDVRPGEMAKLTRLAAGRPLATIVVQCLDRYIKLSGLSSDHIRGAMEDASSIWIEKRCLQIEEHCARHPRGSNSCARAVRDALRGAVKLRRPDTAVDAFLTTSHARRSSATKATGLDEYAP